MLRKYFIIVAIVSMVSSGLVVPLHMDGSAGKGHLHDVNAFVMPMAKKDSHAGNESMEKMVSFLNSGPALPAPEVSILSSLDQFSNFPKRAPPA